ncbi:MAG: hypothetical protein JWO74_4472, partial [Solirubrobacterales bacterium]|nr:hypothetical protein [Solirubrobacterales bacterium]
MSTGSVRLESRGALALLTIGAPPLNRIDAQVIAGLRAALDEVGRVEGLRAQVGEQLPAEEVQRRAVDDDLAESIVFVRRSRAASETSVAGVGGVVLRALGLEPVAARIEVHVDVGLERELRVVGL